MGDVFFRHNYVHSDRMRRSAASTWRVLLSNARPYNPGHPQTTIQQKSRKNGLFHLFCCVFVVFICFAFGCYCLFALIWFEFGLVWVGLVWFGIVWFGLVWFGLVLFCLVWIGLVWVGLFVCMFVCLLVNSLPRWPVL